MVKQEKQEIAYKTIHNLLIYGRILSYKEKKAEIFSDYFDSLEYLMGMLLDKANDRTEQFEMALSEICVDYQCEDVFLRYEKEIFY